MAEPLSLFSILVASPLQAGSLGVVLLSSCGWIGKTAADFRMARRKADFEKQLARTKSELDQQGARVTNQLQAELEKVRGELARDADTHRFRLKKQEVLFEQEVEAAKEFLELHRNIRPTWSHPDEDYHDAQRNVTDRLGNIETKLSQFLSKFGYVMTPETRSAMQICITTAGNHKFDGSDNYRTDYLDQFMKELTTVEESLLAVLRA